jgi:hypothetical protein
MVDQLRNVAIEGSGPNAEQILANIKYQFERNQALADGYPEITLRLEQPWRTGYNVLVDLGRGQDVESRPLRTGWSLFHEHEKPTRH